MTWIQRLFNRQSHQLAVEADRWKNRARAARRAGMHKLAAQCDSNSAMFAVKQQEVRASAAEAHGWHLEAQDL